MNVTSGPSGGPADGPSDYTTLSAVLTDFAQAGFVGQLRVDDDGESFKVVAAPTGPGLRPFHGTDAGFIEAGSGDE